MDEKQFEADRQADSGTTGDSAVAVNAEFATQVASILEQYRELWEALADADA